MCTTISLVGGEPLRRNPALMIPTRFSSTVQLQSLNCFCQLRPRSWMDVLAVEQAINRMLRDSRTRDGAVSSEGGLLSVSTRRLRDECSRFCVHHIGSGRSIRGRRGPRLLALFAPLPCLCIQTEAWLERAGVSEAHLCIRCRLRGRPKGFVLRV